jgi:hypothetical protein
LERDGSAKKVHLSTNAAVELVANRIRADLAGEINLQG